MFIFIFSPLRSDHGREENCVLDFGRRTVDDAVHRRTLGHSVDWHVHRRMRDHGAQLLRGVRLRHHRTYRLDQRHHARAGGVQQRIRSLQKGVQKRGGRRLVLGSDDTTERAAYIIYRNRTKIYRAHATHSRISDKSRDCS